MVVLNYTGGEVNAKIVYYGPGLSGKTTNLEFIHDRTPAGSRGKMVSMKTQTDRTLFFDFLPLELGEINGYRTRFLLYTVPGQVYYNATRKLVLKGVDAVVFVADSSRAKLDENLESLRNLEQNLNEHGMSLDEIPWVIQYNKRDASDAMVVPDLDARLNPMRVPSYEAVANNGNGVYETFHGIATLVYGVLKERLERGDLAGETAAAPAHVQVQAAQPAPAKPGRAQPATPNNEAEFEFDTAIDTALREMDDPAARTGARAAATPAAKGKKATRASAPAPAPPQHVPVNEAPMRVTPEPMPVRMATPVAREASAAPRSEGTALETAPEFDLELGRLPALDDASFASDSARDEGPHEFVTDPMRRAAAPKAAPAVPAMPAVPAAPRVEAVVSLPESSVTVPVVLTREQVRAGVRVVLDIRLKDE